MTLYEALHTAIKARQELAQAATPGPWFYNSYGAVFSGPLAQGYDAWAGPLFDAGHTLERSGECVACGDRKDEPYGHGCRHFTEDYDRDPLVAGVPAHHGDTAIRRRQKDAQFIEAEDPTFVLRQCARDLRVLERHVEAWGACVGCGFDSQEERREEWPCPEIRDLADVYAIPLDQEPLATAPAPPVRS